VRHLLITVIATCFFFRSLYGHAVRYDPNPMILTFGGHDGTISVILTGDEPSPACTVLASAKPQAGTGPALVSVTSVGTNPAPTPVLSVHVLRQPQGPSESVRVVGSWTSTGDPGDPCVEGVTGNIAVTVTVNFTAAGPAPGITSVVNGASFLTGIQAGSWTTIRGTNLANNSRTWDAPTEIINGKLPTLLDGVSVTINGKAAVVYYISPSQLNILPPDDSALGPVEVKVSVGSNMSSPAIAQLNKYSPAFFMFDPQGRKYIAAQIARLDGGVDLLGPPGLFGSAATTRPAKPGDIIILYGTGFGPTNPPVPVGEVFSGAAPTSDPVVLTIGGVAAKVQFAGISGAGLYQLNVVVPELADGDQKAVATIGGFNSQDNAFIVVKN
jgi:uncharacterized protein (TIGR03437 family)